MPSRGLYADDCDTFDDPGRLRLRVASFLRGSALLRRRPETSELVGLPPVCLWNVRRVRRSIGSVLVDFAEFKRKALRELSGVLDFHIRSADAPVPAGRVCRVLKQLVEDNLAIAARIKYPRKWPPALRKWSRAFRALVVRTVNW